MDNQNQTTPSENAQNVQTLKSQYNELRQKIINLEKNNLEMIQLYEAEEERLIKSNEFLMNRNNQNGKSKNIKQLESDVLKMKNDIQELKKLLAQKNNTLNNLTSELIDQNNEKEDLNWNNSNEIKAKEEYLKNYKNKLEEEFKQKLLIKHKELIDYCTNLNNQNNKNIIDINEIKNFSIKEENITDQKQKKSDNDEKLNNINLEKIDMIISIICLKEEYPREFFIDYILDEAYLNNNANPNSQTNEDSFRKLLELEKEVEKEPENEIQKFIQKKPKKKSCFHGEVPPSDMSKKICKLFDIKNEEDIQIITNYLEKINKENENIHTYFENNLSKHRFIPYDIPEVNKNNSLLQKLFKNSENLHNLHSNANNCVEFEYFDKFTKSIFNSTEWNEELFYYALTTMKLSKKERKSLGINNSLRLNEFYLPALLQIINN